MTNEEIAVMINNGQTELIPVLWDRVRKLVAKFANSYYMRHYELCKRSGVTDDDLMQEAYFGFIKAIQSYPPESGNMFTTYLNYPIQSCFVAITGQRTSKSRKEPLNHAASLDTPVNDTDDGVTLQDTLQDENTYIDFEQIELTDMQKIVREELAQLKDAKQQEFITDHYLHEQSYQTIANKYGISRERVRQIASAGLRKLRNSKRLRALHGEFCNHIQTRFISFIEFNPQYFDLIRDIRERQKREYISYGKQQALIYQLTADTLKSGYVAD